MSYKLNTPLKVNNINATCNITQRKQSLNWSIHPWLDVACWTKIISRLDNEWKSSVSWCTSYSNWFWLLEQLQSQWMSYNFKLLVQIGSKRSMNDQRSHSSVSNRFEFGYRSVRKKSWKCQPPTWYGFPSSNANLNANNLRRSGISTWTWLI